MVVEVDQLFELEPVEIGEEGEFFGPFVGLAAEVFDDGPGFDLLLNVDRRCRNSQVFYILFVLPVPH